MLTFALLQAADPKLLEVELWRNARMLFDIERVVF